MPPFWRGEILRSYSSPRLGLAPSASRPGENSSFTEEWLPVVAVRTNNMSYDQSLDVSVVCLCSVRLVLMNQKPKFWLAHFGYEILIQSKYWFLIFHQSDWPEKKLIFVSNCLVVWCIKIEMDIYSDYIITTNLTIEPLPVFIFGWKSDSPFSGPWMRLQYQRAHSHKSDIMKIFGTPARKVTFAYMLVIMFNFIENST